MARAKQPDPRLGAAAFHIEAQIGDSFVVVEITDPPHAGATVASIFVYIPDVDAAYRRAIAAGAESIAEPVDKPYRE